MGFRYVLTIWRQTIWIYAVMPLDLGVRFKSLWRRCSQVLRGKLMEGLPEVGVKTDPIQRLNEGGYEIVRFIFLI
jgi:hypothetical protein